MPADTKKFRCRLADRSLYIGTREAGITMLTASLVFDEHDDAFFNDAFSGLGPKLSATNNTITIKVDGSASLNGHATALGSGEWYSLTVAANVPRATLETMLPHFISGDLTCTAEIAFGGIKKQNGHVFFEVSSAITLEELGLTFRPRSA